ncbi:MAG: phosphodiesterase [Myxococcota bacterium]
MLIAQITDTHISTLGSFNDRSLRTADHLERAVAHLNALVPRPDVVVATGDLVERGQPEEYVRFSQIVRALEPPLFVVPGNHDGRAALAEAFGLSLVGGFVLYTVERFPVRLIALDTHVPGAAGGSLCLDRLTWLDARLSEQPERPTVVFMHHPPFPIGIPALDAMGLDGSDALATVIARHPQVERVICGHAHRPITRRFAGTIASVGPATAHQLALELAPSPRLGVVMEPPACTLHLWDGRALVTHTSPIATGRPVHVVFDGTTWNTDGAPPPGFHPPGW